MWIVEAPLGEEGVERGMVLIQLDTYDTGGLKGLGYYLGR